MILFHQPDGSKCCFPLKLLRSISKKSAAVRGSAAAADSRGQPYVTLSLLSTRNANALPATSGTRGSECYRRSVSVKTNAFLACTRPLCLPCLREYGRRIHAPVSHPAAPSHPAPRACAVRGRADAQLGHTPKPLVCRRKFQNTEKKGEILMGKR